MSSLTTTPLTTNFTEYTLISSVAVAVICILPPSITVFEQEKDCICGFASSSTTPETEAVLEFPAASVTIALTTAGPSGVSRGIA